MRRHEVSHHSVTAQGGGYGLGPTPEGGTRVRLSDVLEGHGVGKTLLPPATGAARRGVPAFGRRVEEAAEAAA
ncbi:hypothetical protein [Streptomyces sp. NPDC096105]|uniref:hypothetical protein n=1 Tax=Streptomyces sp. NPDC096105 TaxID=3366074 RepID=UPI0037FED080